MKLCKFKALQERSSQSETEEEWYWGSDDGWMNPGKQNGGQREKWTKHMTTEQTKKYWGDHESVVNTQQQDKRRMSSRETDGSDNGDPENTTYQPETQTGAKDSSDDTGGDHVL